MAALHIRDVPDFAVSLIKRRAARHGRSMQAELLSIVTQAANEEEDGEFKWHMVSEGYQGNWSREEMYGDDGR